MKVKYIKQEIADLNGTGRTQAYYKMELKAMSYKSFVSKCAKECNIGEAIIMSVLSSVSEELALYMAEGNSVKLEGIGTFHAKLGVRDDMLQDAFEAGESTRNATTIRVTGVSYRADTGLIKNTLDHCSLEKGGVSRLRKSSLTLDERIQKAQEYLKNKRFMRVGEYERLTGLSHSEAGKELRSLAKDSSSGIISDGKRSHKVYVLRVDFRDKSV